MGSTRCRRLSDFFAGSAPTFALQFWSRTTFIHSSGEYLARINDKRLKRVFAAAIEADQPKLPSVSKPIKRDNAYGEGFPPVTTKRTRAFPAKWIPVRVKKTRQNKK